MLQGVCVYDLLSGVLASPWYWGPQHSPRRPPGLSLENHLEVSPAQCCLYSLT